MQLRTRDIYEAHCLGLCGPLRDHFSTTYGMTNNSVLNQCRYFHVTHGLVPDIMHDILEGTHKFNNYYSKYSLAIGIPLPPGSLKLNVKLLLHQYVYNAKLFPLDFLNKKVSSFNFGNDSKNKPSHISKNHLKQGGELKQSGE